MRRFLLVLLLLCQVPVLLHAGKTVAVRHALPSVPAEKMAMAMTSNDEGALTNCHYLVRASQACWNQSPVPLSSHLMELRPVFSTAAALPSILLADKGAKDYLFFIYPSHHFW